MPGLDKASILLSQAERSGGWVKYHEGARQGSLDALKKELLDHISKLRTRPQANDLAAIICRMPEGHQRRELAKTLLQAALCGISQIWSAQIINILYEDRPSGSYS